MVENGEILRLLKILCEIESPSKKEEKIKKFVKDYLNEAGYRVVEGEYFLAVEGETELIIATHLDTVPVKRKFEYDGCFAWGTGVCDTKGSLTAILVTAKKKKFKHSLAFFCDEEEDGLGSKEFAQKWNKGKYIIVMEPTELKIANRHWGSFELFVEVKGRTAHGAYPEAGINAIEKTFELFNVLKNRGLKLNTLKIEGGGDEYVIPDRCEVKFEIFLEPEEELEKVISEVDFVKNFGKIEIEHAYSGYVSREVDKILEEALRRVGEEVRYCEMKSWTDALNLKKRFDVVVWGPGSLPDCHTEREKIELKDIKIACKVLESLNC
jgi:acetylornithine deacetylase/succinyl-diaminopimelate desuccinylase-like protein